jgi:hypothetical protein
MVNKVGEPSGLSGPIFFTGSEGLLVLCSWDPPLDIGLASALRFREILQETTFGMFKVKHDSPLTPAPVSKPAVLGRACRYPRSGEPRVSALNLVFQYGIARTAAAGKPRSRTRCACTIAQSHASPVT